MQITSPIYQQSKDETTPIWTMFFDGAKIRATVGACVVLISPSNEVMHLSLKLDFHIIADYEAFFWA